MTRLGFLCLTLLALMATSVDALAQIAERKVDIYSEGVRMSGTVLYPQALEGTRLPTVIMSHGWGGTAAMLRPQAERFAQAGYFGQPRANYTPAALARAQSDATRRARGEIGYPPPGAREIGNLRGAPVRESFLRYAPIDDIRAMRGCAMLIIDAEKEAERKPRQTSDARNHPKWPARPLGSHVGVIERAPPEVG